MATSEEKLVNYLNQILAICQDGRYGFETAAQNAKAEELKTLCYSISVDREQFANALRHEVRKAKGEPNKGGGTLGALHRAYIGIKTALTSKDDKIILKACLTGEKVAIQTYKEVLEKALLPADTRNIVSIQHVRIEESIKRLEELLGKISS